MGEPAQASFVPPMIMMVFGLPKLVIRVIKEDQELLSPPYPVLQIVAPEYELFTSIVPSYSCKSWCHQVCSTCTTSFLLSQCGYHGSLPGTMWLANVEYESPNMLTLPSTTGVVGRFASTVMSFLWLSLVPALFLTRSVTLYVPADVYV